jgi:biopolymer transport protein ExbB/TolQ
VDQGRERTLALGGSGLLGSSRCVFLSRTRVNLAELRALLTRAGSREEVQRTETVLRDSPSIEAHIVRAGFGASCAAEAAERMAAETQLQRLRAERSLAFLGTLGTNAPFVGLLGTVIGIVRAFEELDHSGGQLTGGLMAEIGEALGATAVGLLVALPAVAAYNWLQRAIQIRLQQGEALGRDWTAELHRTAELRGVQRGDTDASLPVRERRAELQSKQLQHGAGDESIAVSGYLLRSPSVAMGPRRASRAGLVTGKTQSSSIFSARSCAHFPSP